MKSRKIALIGIISAALITMMSACSSGGDDSDPTSDIPKPSTNNTTWDELVWDDGTENRSRKWAD